MRRSARDPVVPVRRQSYTVQRLDNNAEGAMKTRHAIIGLTAMLGFAGGALAHDTEEGKGQLGKVSFRTSCDPKVQADFDRAVAMLHSFWYSYGEKAFR